MDDQKNRLIAECKRIQENSLWTSTSHFTAASLAGWAQSIGGAVPIAIGGIGGWNYLADPALASPEKVRLAAFLTLVAGVSGSLMAFWDFAKLRLVHFSAGTRYKTIENEARRAWQMYAPDEEVASLKTRVESLTKKYDELGEASEQSGDITFLIARWKIGSKVFINEVDSSSRKK